MKGSIRQRSKGSWELCVDLGFDADGKRRRKYDTVRGTKAEAQRRLRELLTHQDKGVTLFTKRILLRDWLQRWIQEVIARYRRQATKERYLGAIRLHITPTLGHVELEKLAPSHVQEFVARLSASGMHPSGVSLVRTVLGGAMDHAVLMELAYRNPVSQVKRPPLVRKELAPPDVPVVRQALELLRAEADYLYPCIHLLAYTGLRRGEVLALQWDKVDLRAGRLVVEASLTRTRERGLLLQPPKTASGWRVVELDPKTVDVLVEHRQAQQKQKALLREAYSDMGLVFPNELGQWLNPMRLTRAVATLGQRIGHEGMTVRSLRHFHASLALATGENIVDLSKRLGHANVSITSDIYAHSLPGRQKQMVARVAEAMEEDTLPTLPTTPHDLPHPILG